MSLANRGKPLESAINKQHALYESQGRASVIQIPTPYRVVARLQAQYLKVCYTKTGYPDYHVQASGVSFLFDAKHCEGATWPLSNMPAHQADRLTMHERQGGVSFILLERASTWLLPWSWLGPVYRTWQAREAKRGDASIGLAECLHHGTPLVGVDWLDEGLKMAGLPVPF